MAAQVPPFAPVHTFGFGWGADTRAVEPTAAAMSPQMSSVRSHRGLSSVRMA